MNATETKTRISLKNILYATDFSPAAEAALPYAIGLAKRYGAKVHGFHVRHPATYPIVGPEGFEKVIEAAHELAKIEAKQLHTMLAGVPHEVSVCEGEVWPLMSGIMSKEKTDMIVIGTSGRTGVSRFFLGSIAEEIFRKASCPVLTVGPQVSLDAARRLEMKEILYATDFSHESLAALPYAVSLAQENQAGLTLLHVVAAEKAGEVDHAKLHEDSVQLKLQKLLPPDAKVWCEPKCVVERGHGAEKILEVATAIGADLIVLGVRSAEGEMGVATHLSKSVAHAVVTQARCPVLTVRG